MASQSVSFEVWTNVMATTRVVVVTLVHIFNIWAKHKDWRVAEEARRNQSGNLALQKRVRELGETVEGLEEAKVDLQTRCRVMEEALSTACSADDALSRANDALDRGDTALIRKETDITRAEAALTRADGLLTLASGADKSGKEFKAATDKQLESMQTEISLLRTQFENLKPCNCKQTDSGANDAVEQAVPALGLARSGAGAAVAGRRHTLQMPSTPEHLYLAKNIHIII